MSGNEIDSLFDELINQQKKTLLRCANRIEPSVIMDDLLQPNDFSLLENNPLFRYEEGVLAGIQTVEAAIRALVEDLNNK